MADMFEQDGNDASIFDVLVIGSGAAGLAAAIVGARLGLSVLVAEKTRFFGGTTAYSGGGIWCPASRMMTEAGLDDDLQAAEQYIHAVTGPRFDASKVQAYLRHCNEALGFLMQHTPLSLHSSGGPDYEPHLPGAARGRCHLTGNFDGRRLGTWLHTLRPALPQMGGPLGMQIGFADLVHIVPPRFSPKALGHLVKLLGRQVLDVVRYQRGTRLTNGNALAGALFRGALDAEVTFWNETEATQLLYDGGRVTGAVLNRNGLSIEVRTRRGVFLAAGGYGAAKDISLWDPALEQDFPCLQAEGCTGDGIALGQDAGGQIALGNVSNAIWAPMSATKGISGERTYYPHLIFDRLMPGFLIVNEKGRRFANEADHYQGLGNAIAREQPQAMYLITDRRGLARYGLGMARPAPWRNRAYLRSNYLLRAPTLERLAALLNLNPADLIATIRNFNSNARDGKDPDFGRGESSYALAMGDSTHSPNPSLGPIEAPPFFAIRLLPGMLSTTKGLITDDRANVLNGMGQPIPGLFAVGADMNSVWGGHYPGGGASLGAALVFGYIAAKSLSIPSKTEAEV